MPPRIEIFSAPLCGACQQAKAWFDRRGLPYTVYDLAWTGRGWEDSPASRLLRERCGEIDFVPQIFIGDRHVRGWAELSALIDSGGIDDLLT